MLPNLHEIAVNTRQKYRDEFSAGEVVLSQAFKDAYGASLRKDGQNVDFTAHTAIITTSGNLKMYIPNQWFCAAAYTVEFIQVLLQYKKIIDEIISINCGNASEKKDYITKLKTADDAKVIEAFKMQVTSYMKTRVPADELDTTVSYLTLFATDYSWWFGNKTIDRGDTYVSPVLSILGVVNASQGYIADISYKFATEPAIAEAVVDMTGGKSDAAQQEQEVNPADGVTHPRLTGGVNEIVYGAPGTGKSRYLADQYGHTTRCTRVVFHPEYTFYDFIGSYKPVTLYKETGVPIHTRSGIPFESGEPVIDYKFVPGPFIATLTEAWLHPGIMHTIIIEEINRANSAAVFGDIFQLLDRDVDGNSEYAITPSEELLEHLLSIPGMQQHLKEGLKIPSNMNIVATMNSADQGVMPMDSAFKRRWSFKYTRIAISGAVHENAPITYAHYEITWGNLVRAINDKLVNLGFDEDRLIGPYFIRPEEIGSKRATDKLLLYLWDDVVRHNRESFFNSNIKTFADLSDSFSEADVFDLLADPTTNQLLSQQQETSVLTENNE